LLLILGVVAFFLLFPLLTKSTFIVFFLTVTLIWVGFATSLRIPMTLGLVSFAHAGFYAIGAYASALLKIKLGVPFWLAFPGSGIITGLVALVVGIPMLRTKGHYFFLSSFALGMVIILMFSTQWRSLFGGTMGISNIPTPMSPTWYYYLALAFACGTIAVVYRIDHCRIGIEWRGIKEIDDLAALVGINTVKAKISAFVAGSILAGMAGSLLGHFIRFISPEAFGFPTMLFCLTAVIVGGIESPWGPAIGVVLLRGIILFVGGLREWEALIYSAMLVGCVALLPQGVVSLPKGIRERRRKMKALRV
jgi:branched-chain amino acid transport system permease protein